MRCADLLEAEGRTLRAQALHVGLALAAMLAAALVAFLAVIFFAAALYLSLREAELTPPQATVICGAVCAGLAALLVLAGRRIAR